MQARLAVGAEVGQTCLVSPLVVGGLPSGIPFLVQAGLAVGAEVGLACLVSPLVESADFHSGKAVLVQARLAVGAEVGRARLVSPLVELGQPSGIPVLVPAGLAVGAEEGLACLVSPLVIGPHYFGNSVFTGRACRQCRSTTRTFGFPARRRWLSIRHIPSLCRQGLPSAPK